MLLTLSERKGRVRTSAAITSLACGTMSILILGCGNPLQNRPVL